MRFKADKLYMAIAMALATCVPGIALAFNSGSTGADGVLNPTADTEVPLPPDGILNYTSINIPTGVTVRFRRNASNTPVTLLVGGDVTIAGTLDVSGRPSPGVGSADGGNLADDGQGGTGGPGGFDGGRGGDGVTASRGNYGLGPGGGPWGNGSTSYPYTVYRCGGAGGSYATNGEMGSYRYNSGSRLYNCDGGTGALYGSTLLIPLIGGSGGGGGQGGASLAGSGGGGGGGALVLASSGTVNVTGAVLANGGNSGAMTGANCGTSGGGGSGGAIRMIATTISGNGTISAAGGTPGVLCTGLLYTTGSENPGGFGGAGRIRLEADTLTRTAGTSPPAALAGPGAVFVSGLPTLRFTRVGGTDAPALPTGNADIVLPAGTANPVVVEFGASGIPLNTTINLTVKTNTSAPVVATSSPLSGSLENSTASASVNLSAGASVLQASVAFAIVASVGDELSKYAKGERVEKIELAANYGGTSTVTLITVSGKRYSLPSHAPFMPAG